MVGDVKRDSGSGTRRGNDDLPGFETTQARLEHAVRVGAPGDGRAERPELGHVPRPVGHEEARDGGTIERDSLLGQAGHDREGGGPGVADQRQGSAREMSAKGRESREGEQRVADGARAQNEEPFRAQFGETGPATLAGAVRPRTRNASCSRPISSRSVRRRSVVDVSSSKPWRWRASMPRAAAI
jgi:hypothetical protein